MKIQDIFKEAGNSSCLALCYCYIGVFNTSPVFNLSDEKTQNVMLGIALLDTYSNTHYLDKDFSVLDGQSILDRIFTDTGLKAVVGSKTKISSISELNEDVYNLVNFQYNDKNHWVLYDGKILKFNSLENSNCFKYGKPFEVRTVKIIKEV